MIMVKLPLFTLGLKLVLFLSGNADTINIGQHMITNVEITGY